MSTLLLPETNVWSLKKYKSQESKCSSSSVIVSLRDKEPHSENVLLLFYRFFENIEYLLFERQMYAFWMNTNCQAYITRLLEVKPIEVPRNIQTCRNVDDHDTNRFNRKLQCLQLRGWQRINTDSLGDVVDATQRSTVLTNGSVAVTELNPQRQQASKVHSVSNNFLHSP